MNQTLQPISVQLSRIGSRPRAFQRAIVVVVVVVRDCGCRLSLYTHIIIIYIYQSCPTGGPRAASGPRPLLIRPETTIQRGWSLPEPLAGFKGPCF